MYLHSRSMGSKEKQGKMKRFIYVCMQEGSCRFSQKTPNTLIHGELDRCPLYIDMVMKSVKYQLNLVELPSSRLLKAAHEAVKSVDNKGVETLASDIRKCSFQYGFSIVWVSQHVGNKTCFFCKS